MSGEGRVAEMDMAGVGWEEVDGEGTHLGWEVMRG